MNVASLLQDSPSDRRPPKQDPLRWPQQNNQQQPPPPPPPQQAPQQKQSWPPQQPPYGQPYAREPYPRQPPPPPGSVGGPYAPRSQQAPLYPSPPPGPGGPAPPQAYNEPSPMYAPMGALRQPGPPPRDHRERERERDRDQRDRDQRDRERERDRDRERERERDRDRDRDRDRERERDPRDFAPHSPHPSLAWQTQPPPLPTAHQQQPPPGPQQQGGPGQRTFQGQFHTSFVPVREASPPRAPKAHSSKRGEPRERDRERERDRDRDREREAREVYAWAEGEWDPGMNPNMAANPNPNTNPGAVDSKSGVGAATPAPPPPREPLERVFRAKRTISLGTFVFPHTPFPYAFPAEPAAPPALTPPASASISAADSTTATKLESGLPAKELTKDALPTATPSTSQSKDADDPDLLALETRATLLFPAAHLPFDRGAMPAMRVWGGALPGAVPGSASSSPARGDREKEREQRERERAGERERERERDNKTGERERERERERDRHHLGHGHPLHPASHSHLNPARALATSLSTALSTSLAASSALNPSTVNSSLNPASAANSNANSGAKAPPAPTHLPASRRLYTDDSHPLAAAVHAGLVRWSALARARREGRDVRVEVRVVRVVGSGGGDVFGASGAPSMNAGGSSGAVPGKKGAIKEKEKDAKEKDAKEKEKDAKEKDAKDAVVAGGGGTEAVGRFVGGWGARCARGWADMFAAPLSSTSSPPGSSPTSTSLAAAISVAAREGAKAKEKEGAKDKDAKDKEVKENEKKEEDVDDGKEEGEIELDPVPVPLPLPVSLPPVAVAKPALPKPVKRESLDEERALGKEGEEDGEGRGGGGGGEADDPSDDGRTLLSGGWGAGHDGSAFEVLGVWVEGKNAAHARTRPNRAQRLAEYAARRVELACTSAAFSLPSATTAASVATTVSFTSAKDPSPSSSLAVTSQKAYTYTYSEDNEAYMRLRACSSLLCPARPLKRRTRPWEREHPPMKSANGSVLGVVWEVPEDEHASENDKECGHGPEERCACLAALKADQGALRGRTVVCGFGSKQGRGVGFKYDPEVVRGVLFPEPEPVIVDEERMVVDGEDGDGEREEAIDEGDEEEEEPDADAGRARKRRRVSGLEEVYAAAMEGDVRGLEEHAKDDSGDKDKDKMEEDGEVDADAEVGEKTPMERERTPTGVRERTRSRTPTKKEKTPPPPKEKKQPREVHLVTADGLLVFSPASAAPATQASDGDAAAASEEPQWDIVRVGADGAREALHHALSKDAVDLGEGGVRFRDAASAPEEAGEKDMPMDGETTTKAGTWGERVAVVLWRYGSAS
ncbi:hypothetical protein C8R47DRAFT_1313364 [Mycena vitilis]|nr:hypothetical protein C8R47DRAFT_1313364 [Mycena vitilis]